MRRKSGKKPARGTWTREDRIQDLLGYAARGTHSKKAIMALWDVSESYFQGIWTEAKRVLASEGRAGLVLVSSRSTDFKITLSPDHEKLAEAVAQWNKTKKSAEEGFRIQSTNLRNGSESTILDHVDKLVAKPTKVQEMTAEELDALVEELLAEADAEVTA